MKYEVWQLISEYGGENDATALSDATDEALETSGTTAIRNKVTGEFIIVKNSKAEH
jgi:hypothetical protein